MGSAIVLGVARRSKNFLFHTFDPIHRKSEKLAREVGGKSVRRFADLGACDYFLLACKPQQFTDLAASLKEVLKPKAKIISVLAGISSRRLRNALGIKKVARVMPNTPCLIGCGAAAIYFSGMNAAEKKVVRGIFSAVAKVFEVHSDDKIDAATAMIGSGPAYIFEIARIFAKKFGSRGFPKKTAEQIVKEVFKGASLLMDQSSTSIEELRNKVTSKKGTTAAALKVFQKHHLHQTLEAALNAAYKRAKQLSR